MGVSVRHNSRMAALVAAVAAVMTVAWFSRALQTGSALDWAWCVAMAVVALLQLLVIRDGRAPLMVADDHGVRVRHGRTWSGLRWQDIANVEVTSPRSWLRDGQIVVHPRVVSVEDSLRAQAAFEEYGSEDQDPGGAAVVENSTEAYVVPLARTTRLEFDGLSGDLVSDLDALASGRVPVLVLTKIESEKAPKEKAEKAPKPEKARRRRRAAPKPEKARRRRQSAHRSRRRRRRRRQRRHRSPRSCQRRRPPRPRSRRSFPAC